MAQIQVRDADGHGIPDIHIGVAHSHDPNAVALDNFKTDSAGNLTWPIPHWPMDNYVLHVNTYNVTRPEWAPGILRASDIVTPEGDLRIVMGTVDLPAVPLPRLAMKDAFYLNVPVQGTIGFSDYWRWLRGEQEILKTIYTQCQALGPGVHNARSVFFSMDNINRLHPEEWPHFYTELDAFAEFAMQYGQYIFAIYIADGGLAFSSKGQAQEHVRRLNEWVDKWGFFAKLANEGKSHANLPWNPADFPRPAAPFCYVCHNGDNFDPKDPQGDLQCYHPTRKGNGAIKDCNVYDHPARQKDSDYSYPSGYREHGVGVGEPDGFGLDPRPDGKNYSIDHRRAREMGVWTSGGTAAFSFMLTPAGKLSLPFDDLTYSLVKAWFRV